jgi:ABC-2 type transport system ATP-binding protein
MTDRAGDFVDHLSGGLKRRIEIAKGLLHKPSLLLMDEPSTGLDPGARRDMWEMLSLLKTEGVTIVLTTHLMEEGDRCDRLAIIHKGRIVTEGTPDELKKKIGGDIISIQTKNPVSLLPKLKTQFGGNPVIVEDIIRLEIENGHKVIPSIVEAFPGLIDAMTLGKPTLEDVFVHETGERIHADDVSEERL